MIGRLLLDGPMSRWPDLAFVPKAADCGDFAADGKNIDYRWPSGQNGQGNAHYAKGGWKSDN
jgi:hypothetical protein